MALLPVKGLTVADKFDDAEPVGQGKYCFPWPCGSAMCLEISKNYDIVNMLWPHSDYGKTRSCNSIDSTESILV